MFTKVTFRLSGGPQPLILVPARVNGEGIYDFILDTGAGTSLLTPELAARLGVETIESKEGMGAAGKVKVSLGRVASLAVGDASAEGVEVAITNEVERIGAALGAHVDGVVGYNFLKDFAMTVDYGANNLRLARDAPEEMGDARARIKFRLANAAKPLVLVPALVEGAGEFQFALDTGASTTVISPDLAQAAGLHITPVPEMTGAGGTMHASVGEIESLSVGGARVENLTVMVVEFLGMLSQIVGAKLDGIIGYNYLREFKVGIDYPREILRLE
jgi:predicted aspartyl protease